MPEHVAVSSKALAAREQSLAEVFHLNTKMVPDVAPVLHLAPEDVLRGALGYAVKNYNGSSKLALPAPRYEAPMPLWDAICQRCSCRAWAHAAIGLDALSMLLYHSAGIVRTGSVDGQATFHRAAPSGGGRYPIEVYPIVFRAQDVPPGVYHYYQPDHTLDMLQQTPAVEEHFAQCTTYPHFIRGASVAFVLTAVLERTTSKYLDRGYRYVLLEAGHIAQNLCLAATALGLGSLCLAGYYDQQIEQLLWIDGLSESPVYIVIAGQPRSAESVAPAG